MVDIPQDALEQIRDTINTLGPKLAQIVENSSPTPYVTKNLEISEISLGVAIFAALIGLVGTIYGFLSYKWSKETAKNVAHTGINVQLAIAEDFVEALYGRIVCAKAVMLEPSKVTPNIVSTLKMPAFSDYFHFDDYKTNEKAYIFLLEIGQRVIDFNNTVDICISHIEKTGSLSEKDKQDLEKKPSKILQRIVLLCEHIAGSNDFGYRTLTKILQLHQNHLRADGYPNIIQYAPKKDSMIYRNTVTSICSRSTACHPTLINLLQQFSSTYSDVHPQSEIKYIADWLCQALLIDAAIEIKKI